MTDTLPGLATPKSMASGQQWRIESLQLVNWGGFHGHVRVPLDAASTLISGPSGSGKSTLLDAYIALMMPDTTPFNGASNDATMGRARNAEQRNLLSYLRGKTDIAREATGELTDRVIRQGTTWGAVGGTFRNDSQQTVTAFRVYYVPASATRDSEIRRWFCLVDGQFDLADLDRLRSGNFDKRALRTAFPGVTISDTFTGYADRLYSRLGVGGRGDWEKPLRLLARIQGGYPVKTVDGLYKDLVLETPETYEAADKAIAHFQDLEDAYTAMEDEEKKRQILERIPELHAEWQAHTATDDLIGTLGHTQEGPSPFNAWRFSLERSLLETDCLANRREQETTAAEWTAASDTRRRAEREYEDNRSLVLSRGGEGLKRLQERASELQDRLNRVSRDRSEFDARVEVLDDLPTTQDEFAEMQGAARSFLDAFEERRGSLTKRMAELDDAIAPLRAAQLRVEDEVKSMHGREGRVPRPLHEARLRMAQAVGLPPGALPFVAELLDIAPGEERWRTAVEVTLASVARVVLVDEERLEDLSAAIDGIRLSPRVNFEGVPLRPFVDAPGEPDRISGKVIHKDSPFSGWVQDRIRRSNLDALCVENPQDLRGEGPKVTVSGQTRTGRRGAHGINESGNIIGFSSAARVQELRQELADLSQQITALKALRHDVEAKRVDLEVRKTAHEFVLSQLWSEIDVESAKAALDRNQADQQQLLRSDNELEALMAMSEELDRRRQEAWSDEVRLQQEVTRLDAEHTSMQARLAHVQQTLTEWQNNHRATTTAEQREYLDKSLRDVGDPTDRAGLPETINRLRKRLIEQRQESEQKGRRARQNLEDAFKRYKDNWDDPNLGDTVASYPNYLEILERIISTGLHERKEEWRRRLTEWSGQDLVPLSGAFDTAIEAIQERLIPINRILERLPFGAGNDRLQIVRRTTEGDDIKKFRRDLRRLSQDVTNEFTDEEVTHRFRELQKFMAIIREDSTRQSGNKRDYYLDVRKHVEITAERTDLNGEPVCTYTSLGGKSGGETQELVAFIVGAALRFQLGDEDRDLPRFAPVFLDEGFIKSDSQFAGRAVEAWKGLGFQLVIGAPLDKVTALEPRMDTILTVNKSLQTGYSYLHNLTAPQPELTP